MRLYGKNSVIERLRTNPQSVSKIYVELGVKLGAALHSKAKQHGIPIVNIPQTKMAKIGRTKNTQGVMIDINSFEYAEYDALIENCHKNKRCPVFLDAMKDPQNLGAIIRSLACLGKFAVVLPTHDSVEVTEAALRVASGGENYVPIAKVANINKALKKAKDLGFWLAGAVVQGGKPLEETEFPLPIALVVGSEQKGIRDVVKQSLDLEVTIPMSAETISFNAAHAATILCYEITRQKIIRKKEKPS